MSVSRKVLRKMKKVMGVISTIPVLTACSSQISRAEVNVGFDPCNKVLYFSGKDGVIDSSWRRRYSSESIKCVVIDDGIKKIGDRAFSSCKSLKKINIPKSVTSIASKAFYCCESLEEVNIPNSVSIIDESAFAVSGLEKVEFEDMSRRDSNSCWDVLLRGDAFGACEQLGILDLGDNTNMSRIAKVERCAFYGCDPNFVALEGRNVRGKFYNTVLNYRYNYFIPHAFLFDSMNDRINRRRG